MCCFGCQSLTSDSQAAYDDLPASLLSTHPSGNHSDVRSSRAHGREIMSRSTATRRGPADCLPRSLSAGLSAVPNAQMTHPAVIIQRFVTRAGLSVELTVTGLGLLQFPAHRPRVGNTATSTHCLIVNRTTQGQARTPADG